MSAQSTTSAGRPTAADAKDRLTLSPEALALIDEAAPPPSPFPRQGDNFATVTQQPRRLDVAYVLALLAARRQPKGGAA